MRLCYLLLASTLCLGGCIGNMALDTMSASENNMYNLWRISKGMSQARVLQIMHKPFDYETFQFDQDTYDVWFYITRMTTLGQTRMVPQNLTPLTFKNGVLVDVGWVYYNHLLKEEVIRAKIETKPSPEAPLSPETEENIQLEKALQIPPGSPTTPSTPSTSAPAQQTPSTPAPQPSNPKKTQPTQKTPVTPTQKTPETPTKLDQGQGYVPKNQLPGTPTKKAPNPPNQLPGLSPSTPPSNTPSSQKVSMCTKPKNPNPVTGDSQPANSSNPSSSTQEDNSSDKYKWDSEDQRMKEEESEEDFDYW